MASAIAYYKPVAAADSGPLNLKRDNSNHEISIAQKRQRFDEELFSATVFPLPLPAASLRVHYTVHPSGKIRRDVQLVQKQNGAGTMQNNSTTTTLESVIVGEMVYFESHQTKVFVNRAWMPRPNIRHHAHRSHTPQCAFHLIKRNDDIIKYWQYIVAKLTEIQKKRDYFTVE